MEENHIKNFETPRIKDHISSNRRNSINFIQSLSRRLGRRSTNDVIYNSEEDLRSSSSDLSDCNSLRRTTKEFYRSSSDLSNYPSESNNSDLENSAVKKWSKNKFFVLSFSKALQNLSGNKSFSKKKQPQRILRQPVNYVYLKGMSGLPTRRVPRSSVCCQYAVR